MFVDLVENILRTDPVKTTLVSMTTCAIFRKLVIAAEDFGATTRRSSGIKRLLRRTWEVISGGNPQLNLYPRILTAKSKPQKHIVRMWHGLQSVVLRMEKIVVTLSLV